jgi:CubicO group peptidase (beta-lactamase class C family)
MITLAKLIETISNRPFEQVVHDRVFAPLGMAHTGYNPGFYADNAVPTEPVEPWREALRRRRFGDKRLNELKSAHPAPDGKDWIKGEVHDPTATVLGGIAGHAGLFSTLEDLVKFAKVLVNGGEPLFGHDTFALFTTRQEEKSTRALGWDTKSPEGSSAGTKFGPKSFGHTGFTGTCLWVDPERKFFAILLGNRVHPTANNLKISQLRPKFHDTIWTLDY